MLAHINVGRMRMRGKNLPNGRFDLVWSFRRVRCSDMLRIGRGCLSSIREDTVSITRTATHRARESPLVVVDGSTTGRSSVSMDAMIYEIL